MLIETVQAGETLWAIARRFGANVDEVMRLNGITDPERLVIGEALVVPTEARRHTVRPGESFWSISRIYGVTVEQLQAANPGVNPNLLQPGMVLNIPERPKTTIQSNGYLLPVSPQSDQANVRNVAEFLSTFSIFQYRTDVNGDLVPPNDAAALAAIRQTDAVAMMVVTNFSEGTFSAPLAHTIFTDQRARERLFSEIVRTLRDKRFYALNIDFEHVFPADRERYNNFLRELAGRVHEAGFPISTALAPKMSATQVGEWYEAHDYPVHGQIVDFVILMTYEWGWSGGPPMAVAPIPQVRAVLDYAISVIPRQKILLGAPLYGYDWTLPFVKGGKFARSLSPQAAVEQAARVGANIQFDYTAQAPFYRYYDADGKEHVVWFEDARSMQAKFNLIDAYGLRGISYWVLGNEFPQNWALLQDRFNIRKFA
ncbi:MAG TPA: LysM peptidoglycan-binding domain-containing protein [Bacilli bacterium]